MKRPNKTRMDMSVQRLSVVHASHGVTAWGGDPGHRCDALGDDSRSAMSDNRYAHAVIVIMPG